MEHYLFYLLLAIKYIVAAYILLIIVLAPLWIAAKTSKDKPYNAIVRLSTLTLGWTGIGWLIGLFVASKK